MNDDSNPWLSEFDGIPWVKRQLQTSPGLMAFGFAILAFIPLILSYAVRADCMLVQIRVDGIDHEAVNIYFGYLAELNHGLFYLIGVPLFIWLGLFFIDQIKDAFARMYDQRMIEIHTDGPPGGRGDGRPVYLSRLNQELAYLNRPVFFAVLVLGPLGWGMYNFCKELPGVDKEMFGWVQAAKIHQLNGRKLGGLASWNIKKLDPLLIARDTLTNAQQATDQSQQTRPAGSSPPSYTFLSDGKRQQLIRKYGPIVTVIRAPKPDRKDGSTFAGQTQLTVFLYAALVVASLSHAIITWIALKAIFVVGILIYAWWVPTYRGNQTYEAYRGWSGHFVETIFGVVFRILGLWFRTFKRPIACFRVCIHVDDPVKRFGLRDLDTVFNLFLVMGALGSVILVCSHVSNVAKGTSFLTTHDPMFSGQLVVAAAVAIPVSVICFFPMAGIWRIAHRARALRLNGLAVEIGDAAQRGHVKKMRELEQEKEAVRANSVWPIKDRSNLAIAGFCLALFLFAVPFQIVQEVAGGPSGAVKPVLSIAEQLPRALYRFVDRQTQQCGSGSGNCENGF